MANNTKEFSKDDLIEAFEAGADFIRAWVVNETPRTDFFSWYREYTNKDFDDE